MAEAKKILIVEARFYEDITDTLAEGAMAVLGDAGYGCERIAVPGVFEIPAAVNLAWNSGAYAGCVTLGCVIRGETDHYDHICREMSRRLMDMSVEQNMPHGFGVLTVESRDQAEKRAALSERNTGGRAGEACLAMMALKQRFA
ncbi:MAG: 6,7-dimethyl-8-ribityllumazine synthase [Rhodospirillaceae bacterium]|jgi:6,7-dimethyl-8-ribityllumazine synthase|nr:6,7-dimethyl-8-ribityllumazine synthase [Rhodospirillaceae bacterium]MBT3886743.1 6,7-dimethyl-8-ribityllumazine synthase [Rhodospirillaceae bacterium]MBT4115104.1 6,7-dimethyl-8-ribityllumazine synthase [Rhodospirillaceae bacterium]MBT4674326.1 6,7-dimethyl-8-ribityllumazine synthase [Rhodospirillaceae bacterium]MBT4721149.1 6,7-dimethyl-8-ribityllumazine synthase [Rhodospirillaceae bacterium]